ncbi:MAG: hypothetical protein ACRDV0_04695 [Acidimicrobiales bacterium]
MTDTNAGSPASAHGVNAASGELSGALGPGLASVAVPLVGPATWTLVASDSVRATLRCPNASDSVVGSVVVGAGESCQLVLVTSDASARPTWRLIPHR